MNFLNKVDLLGFRDWIKQHFQNPSQGCASEVPPVFELLEPRVLLSGDPVGVTPIDLCQDIHEAAIVVDLVPGGGDVRSEAGKSLHLQLRLGRWRKMTRSGSLTVRRWNGPPV